MEIDHLPNGVRYGLSRSRNSVKSVGIISLLTVEELATLRLRNDELAANTAAPGRHNEKKT